MMTHNPSPSRYDRMPYARCGRSGLRLPRLSLGLYQHFSDKDPYAHCAQLVCAAFDQGITHLDLANNYGSNAGDAESLLGRIVRRELAAHRDELVIATKAGYDMWPGPYGEWGSRKHLLASLDQSLRRLGLDYVDVFYSHRPDPETPIEETMGALATAVRQGKALYAGISNYGPEATRQALQALRAQGVPCLVHQAPYSMLNRGIEAELLPLLAEEGVGAVVFQPLQRGLLSEAWAGELSFAQQARLHNWGIPASWVARVAPLAAHARARGQGLPQLALAWALRDARVCSAIVGVSSLAQLHDCIAALDAAPFCEAELAQLDALLTAPLPA